MLLKVWTVPELVDKKIELSVLTAIDRAFILVFRTVIGKTTLTVYRVKTFFYGIIIM
jgi:hypothetical protein